MIGFRCVTHHKRPSEYARTVDIWDLPNWPINATGDGRPYPKAPEAFIMEHILHKPDFQSLKQGDLISLKINKKFWCYLMLEDRQEDQFWVEVLDLSTNTKITINLTSKTILRGRVQKAGTF